MLKVGLDGFLNGLLEKWYDLVVYIVRYLDFLRIYYLYVWKRIFNLSRKEEWNIVLFLEEVLFFIFISNAKVERIFSLMNCIKIDFWVVFSEYIFNNFVRI